MAAPMDCNVLWNGDQHHLENRFKEYFKVGYRVLVVNNEHGPLQSKGKKKKQQDQMLGIKSPKEILLPEGTFQNFKKCDKSVKQLSRFTTELSDVAQVPKLQTDPVIKEYDILAVCPTTEKTFNIACSTLDIDVISLRMSERLPFHIRRQQVGVAIERGIHFEICYSPAILDSSCRRQTISNAHSLLRVCKGKNVIISGGCTEEIHIRGPYDVINVGLLFGMTSMQSKEAVTTNCRSVLMHAASRRTAKCALAISKASDLSSGETWKLTETNKVLKTECVEADDGPPTKKAKT